jgi:hypothetical protein
MQYVVDGKTVSLTQKDYVTQGGEGKIFQQGKVAYKIYDDATKMIPVGKIQELSVLDSPNIVRPKSVIYSKTKNVITGFTMDWVGSDNYALCKLFTNTFQNANGITNDHIIELVENIKNTIISPIHEKECLMVDGNEFNYLVRPDFITPLFIDVNSYKTRSFPPTAIMPSIRDWKNPTDFTQSSDWFSFAIVSFQLFVGIHPFKGKHRDYKKNDFQQRIIDSVSVFNSDVRLPPTVRDFDLIPSDYRDWYYRLFEKGERVFPPKMPGTLRQIQVQTIVVTSTDNFEIQELKEFDSDIIYHNETITKTKDSLYIGSVDYKVSKDVEVLFTPFLNEPVLCKIENGEIQLKSTTNMKIQQINVACTDKMIINNALFLKSRGKLVELQFNDSGQIVPSIQQVWNIEEKSSKLFGNMVVQSVLGKTYIAIPRPEYKKSSLIIKEIPELDKKQIVDAKHDSHVCMFITHEAGKYNRMIVVFSLDYSSYVVREINDVDYMPLNFVVLGSGVCISIREDDVVEIFNASHPEKIKEIKDPKINSSMRLCKRGMVVRFFQGNKLFTIRLKK